jgi:type III secretory pathway component EscS
MRSRRSTIAAVCVLLVCLICPIVEMFDRWDHTDQTGNDTEYTFVVLGLCVGAVLALAQPVFGIRLFQFARKVIRNLTTQLPFTTGGCGAFFVIPIPLSPPPLALRI